MHYKLISKDRWDGRYDEYQDPTDGKVKFAFEITTRYRLFYVHDDKRHEFLGNANLAQVAMFIEQHGREAAKKFSLLTGAEVFGHLYDWEEPYVRLMGPKEVCSG